VIRMPAMAGCAAGLWPHKTLYNRFVRCPAWASSTESSPTLRPKASQATVTRNILQKTLYRQRHKVENYVRKAKKLPRISMRYGPLSPHILQRYLHRATVYLLARSMSPDP